MLVQEQAQAIEAHLRECPHCARELAELSEYMAAEQTITEPGLPERVKAKATDLLSDLDTRLNLEDVIEDFGDIAACGELAETMGIMLSGQRDLSQPY